MSLLYPVAPSAEAALHASKGLAARETEAERLAGGAVAFAVEAAGPAYATREALAEAFGGVLSQPFVAVRPLADPRALRPPAQPTHEGGRRWPAPFKPPEVVWRLSVSYWRICGEEEAPAETARSLRRRPEARDLDPRTLSALSRQPLRPMKPQQALDIGLFEVRAPEAPHILIPDE